MLEHYITLPFSLRDFYFIEVSSLIPTLKLTTKHNSMKNPLRIFRAKSKFLRIVFLQLILLVVFFGITSANGGYAQELLNKRITIKVENRSIKQVLNEIEKSAGIRFIYSSSLIRSERKITLALDNSTLGEVLENILKPLQLEYKVLGMQIVLNRAELKTSSVQNQPTELVADIPVDILVRGSVKDDKGEPIIGASIIIKGLAKGTTTDVDGKIFSRCCQSKC